MIAHPSSCWNKNVGVILVSSFAIVPHASLKEILLAPPLKSRQPFFNTTVLLTLVCATIVASLDYCNNLQTDSFASTHDQSPPLCSLFSTQQPECSLYHLSEIMILLGSKTSNRSSFYSVKIKFSQWSTMTYVIHLITFLTFSHNTLSGEWSGNMNRADSKKGGDEYRDNSQVVARNHDPLFCAFLRHLLALGFSFPADSALLIPRSHWPPSASVMNPIKQQSPSSPEAL